jgi:hypothetical protein
MLFRHGADKGTASNFCANFENSVTETLAMIRQAFEEESISRTWADRKRATQVKRKVKSMLTIFYTKAIDSLFTMNSS